MPLFRQVLHWAILQGTLSFPRFLPSQSYGQFEVGNAAHLLFDDKCNEASNYRGLLLGCPWGMGATFDELYVARLKTDISQANIVFDVSSSVEHMNHDQIFP